MVIVIVIIRVVKGKSSTTFITLELM